MRADASVVHSAGAFVLGAAMIKHMSRVSTAEGIVLEQHKAQLRRPAPVKGQGPGHEVVAEVEQLQ